MIYWKGPGSAFERISPIDYEHAVEYLKAKEIGLLNRFRIFIEELSLVSILVYYLGGNFCIGDFCGLDFVYDFWGFIYA